MAKLTPLILCNIQKFFLQASVLLDKSNFLLSCKIKCDKG